MLLRNTILLSALSVLLGAQALPAADAQPKTKPLMKDFIGLDVHTVNFKPELYRPVCEMVRDYHSLYWDVKPGPATPTRLPKCAVAEGEWLDWGTLYGSWAKTGFRIDAVVQWGNGDLPQRLWTDIPTQAHAYGKAFADCFGGKGLDIVQSIEISGGADFDAAACHSIFQNMAKGVRDGDPTMKIVTPAVSVGGDQQSKSLETFKDDKDLFDVISIRQTAMKESAPTWERSYPEDPRLPAASALRDMISYRDQNLPDKQIWITGFGYDASTKQAPETGDAARWVDVSDREQAQYIVRSFLLFSARDIDRAYLFWFNDNDVPGLHSSSGITRKYVPKPSYYAMRHLYQTLGDCRFVKATEEPGKLFVYQYASGKDPKDMVFVAWSPTDTRVRTNQIIDLPAAPTSAQRMPLSDDAPAPLPLTSYKDGKLQLLVDGSPVYVTVRLP